MHAKKMCRCIVPMMSAIVLIITCAGPVRDSESISEIMAEEVIAVDSDLIVESASDVEETIAEEPSLSTDAASEGGETIAEIPDTIDEKISEAEGGMQFSEEIGVSESVEDPTVEDMEKASGYSDTDEIGTYWTGGPTSPFPDVLDKAHAYYAAICWAGNNKIANGYGDGTFRSGRQCTRGETMMFLWKFMGRPAPKYVKKSPFSDVPRTHVFYNAVLWSYQKGIARGYADGTFGINRTCTRGHAMMFLWRAAGKPGANHSLGSPFTDIASSHPYYEAVCWGYQTGITKGFSDGSFGVSRGCARGQIVTFLYRYYLRNFYTVRTQNGVIKSINSPISRKKTGNYETILTAEKTPISISTVPQKTLFVGNSLLQGLGSAVKGGRFGMCASDSRHDYYHYVTNAILKKNTCAEFVKLSGTAFEGSTDPNTAWNWYEAHREYFAADLDLIIIQLGDNVNTDDKKAAFRNNIRYFLAQIKSDCPKARVICVGTWYKRTTVINDYILACKENGCDFVSIADLYSQTTLPPAGTTITYNDGSTATAAGGSLSHPNDYGMELIAQRITAQLSLG